MSQNISESYRLNRIAETVARKMGVDLAELQGRDHSIYHTVREFRNPTSHLIQLARAMGRDHVEPTVVLLGQRNNEALVYYWGAISTSTGKPVETVYATDPNRILAVTWGYPEGLGVLEIIHLRGSIALQGLSDMERGMGGSSTITANMNAPEPQHYKGVAQFRKDTLDKLANTIDVLLE